MSAAFANVGFVDEVDDTAVADVEIGISALCAKVEGIAREIPVSRGRHKWIVYVVDRMGEGVRSLNLEAVGEALLEVHLQPVISGVANGFVQRAAGSSGRGVYKGIVIDGIERKSPKKIRPKPEVGKS